jgi:uncharacterized protein YutD
MKDLHFVDRVFTDISKNKDTIVASWGEWNFRLNCVYCDGYECDKKQRI